MWIVKRKAKIPENEKAENQSDEMETKVWMVEEKGEKG